MTPSEGGSQVDTDYGGMGDHEGEGPHKKENHVVGDNAHDRGHNARKGHHVVVSMAPSLGAAGIGHNTDLDLGLGHERGGQGGAGILLASSSSPNAWVCPFHSDRGVYMVARESVAGGHHHDHRSPHDALVGRLCDAQWLC